MPLPVAAPANLKARPHRTAPVSIGAAAFAVLLLLLGPIARRFRGGSIHQMAADISDTLFAIEHEGNDGRP